MVHFKSSNVININKEEKSKKEERKKKRAKKKFKYLKLRDILHIS